MYQEIKKVMAFIQSCYIRKNTPELRKQLEDIGYKPVHPMSLNPNIYKGLCAENFFGAHYEGIDGGEPQHIRESLNDAIREGRVIDCGENEKMFLAIASLTDGTNDSYPFMNTEDIKKKVQEVINQYIK